jgi:hypothetical protein
MQKRKIVAVVFIVAVVVATVVSYEFFVANSLSGYTKVTINAMNQPYFIKFGSVQYNITLMYTYSLGPIVGSKFCFCSFCR